MNPPYWDIKTFIFYYMIGIICALIVGLHFGNLSLGNLNKSNSCYYRISTHWFGYVPFLLMLIAFACLRKVGPGLGGTDSLSYEQDFLIALKDLKNFEDTDVLFGRYTLILRYVTSSPFIYRLVSYSFIAFSIIYFIKELCPSKVSCVPFILVVWPYICGFSSMRSSMAIGFLTIALVALYHKKFSLAWFLLACCVLFHRMMFIFVPIFLLYKPLYRLITSCNKWQLFFLIGVSIIILSLLAMMVQQVVLLFGMLDKEGSPDASYITKGIETNTFESWPMFIQQIFLLCFLFINFKQYSSKKINFIIVISCIDIVITFPALMLGIYRISQCLYIPTLIMWGILIYDFNQKFKLSIRPLISTIFLLFFSVIFYFRMESIYESSSLMPYMFFWQ